MRITVENIYGIFPKGYKEVYNLPGNVEKIGLYEENYYTERPYRLVTEPNASAEIRRVQAVIYDKYRMEGFVNSTQSVELLKYGKITIEDDRGEKIYHAVPLDVTKDNIQGRLYHVSFEFYDKNPYNYALNRIGSIDYLESKNVVEHYGDNVTTVLQVWDITQSPQPFYQLHSLLVPEFKTEQPETTPITAAGGALVHTAVTTKQYIEGLFYVLDEEMEQVLSLLSFAGGRKVKAQMRVKGQIYNLIETPSWELAEVGSELWQLRVKFMYNIVKHFEYA